MTPLVDWFWFKIGLVAIAVVLAMFMVWSFVP